MQDRTLPISFIVPVYNVERYLRACVDSLLAQEHIVECEILLSDDGSTDASGTLCDAYAARYPFVQVIHAPNGGLPIARQRAFLKAQGEWVLPVDSDDWVEADLLHDLWPLLGRKNLDMIQFGRRIMSCGKVHGEYRLPAGEYADANAYTAAGHYLPYVTDRLYRAERVRQMQVEYPADLRIGEDLCFNLQFLLRAHGLKVVSRAYYNYRVDNTDSLMNHHRHQFVDIYDSLRVVRLAQSKAVAAGMPRAWWLTKQAEHMLDYKMQDILHGSWPSSERTRLLHTVRQLMKTWRCENPHAFGALRFRLLALGWASGYEILRKYGRSLWKIGVKIGVCTPDIG